MFKNKPAVFIGASIPVTWLLFIVLGKLGFFSVLDRWNLSDFAETSIIVLLANIPVLVFIGYGIYNAVKSEPTIPKVKERMPWDKGSPLDVDQEWRETINESKNKQEETWEKE